MLNSTPGGLLAARCDPYGAESRIQLMGGLYPDSMLGRHMWHCGRAAEATYRMVCRCEHRGQRMPLCGPGIITGPDGVPYPHPGHAAELSKRQAGACPACIWPPMARAEHEAGQSAEQELRMAIILGDHAGVSRAKQAMETAGARLQELNDQGIVHRCPMRLVEVS